MSMRDLPEIYGFARAEGMYRSLEIIRQKIFH